MSRIHVCGYLRFRWEELRRRNEDVPYWRQKLLAAGQRAAAALQPEVDIILKCPISLFFLLLYFYSFILSLDSLVIFVPTQLHEIRVSRERRNALFSPLDGLRSLRQSNTCSLLPFSRVRACPRPPFYFSVFPASFSPSLCSMK
jgi:hypothetical protein